LRVSIAASTVSIAVPVKRSRVAADVCFRAALDHHVGGFQDIAALDVARQYRGLHGLDRGAGEAQPRRRDAAVVGDLESHVEAAAARLIVGRDRLHRAAAGGFELDVLQVAVEGQSEIGGVAQAAAVLQRVGDVLLDLLGFHGARQPGHRDLLDVLGLDADHVVRPQRGEHLRRRQRAGGAEIGRPIDRDLRRDPGMVDDVADPHHVAGDGDTGAQHRCGDDIVAGLGERRGGARDQQGGGE
jgi:hypothetical protein